MLPGVELARRRRLHQRTATTAAAAEAFDSAPRHAVRPDPSSSAMGEAALLARSRLRERLRGPEPAAVADVATYTLSRAPALDPSDAPPTCSGDRRGSRCSRSKTSNGKKNSTGKENERGDATVSSTRGAGGPAGSGRRSRDSSASEDVCAVCLDALRSRSQSQQRKSLVNLPCSHNYHFDCVRPWLESNHRCPCCRRAVVSL